MWNWVLVDEKMILTTPNLLKSLWVLMFWNGQMTKNRDSNQQKFKQKNGSEVKNDNVLFVIHVISKTLSHRLQFHHDYDHFEFLNKLSIKKYIHLWIFNGQNLNNHQAEKMLYKWKIILWRLLSFEWTKIFHTCFNWTMILNFLNLWTSSQLKNSITNRHMTVKIWINTRMKNCCRNENWSCAVCNSWNGHRNITQVSIESWLWTFRTFEQDLNKKSIHLWIFNGQNLDQYKNEKIASEVKIDHVLFVFPGMNKTFSNMLYLNLDYEHLEPLNKLSTKKINHWHPFDGKNLDKQ